MICERSLIIELWYSGVRNVIDYPILTMTDSELKFNVIGSVREKGSIIEQGVLARLLQMLKAPDSDIRLKTEVTTVLNSLAKGLPEHAAALVQAGLLPVLWERKFTPCESRPSRRV